MPSIDKDDISSIIPDNKRTRPNLPDGPVRLALVDGRIGTSIEAALSGLGIGLIKTLPHPGLYEAVAGHPDMLLHHLGGNRIVFAPGTDEITLDGLRSLGFGLIAGEAELKPEYPADIAYNVARIGGLYFHNLKYTDPVLKRELERQGIEPVNVSQGYSKCSVCIVDDSSIITADRGIADAASKKGLGVLLLESSQDIILPGLKYGFIGGCSGLAGESTLAFFGEAGKLEEYDRIKAFISQRGVMDISLGKGPVTDFGSLLPIACK
ncbi:MAG: hypothetical protein HGA22_06875 [Clostridiales bacterium]|nr:hypothetical protein [Clostridiales bacterium]